MQVLLILYHWWNHPVVQLLFLLFVLLPYPGPTLVTFCLEKIKHPLALAAGIFILLMNGPFIQALFLQEFHVILYILVIGVPAVINKVVHYFTGKVCALITYSDIFLFITFHDVTMETMGCFYV